MSAALNRRYEQIGSFEGAITKIMGFVLCDSSGNPINAQPPTANDQYGKGLVMPKGVTSIVKLQKGIYRLTLDTNWINILGASAPLLYTPPNLVQGTLLGTVDLTGVTLSTLTGLTVKTTGDVGSLYTTTFTLPSSIADIAAQINAGNGGTSVFASIVTNTLTGAKFLKIVSTTLGASSSITVDTTSTAKTQLGLATTAQVGVALGQFRCCGYNTQGIDLESPYQPVQTFDIAYENGAGVGLDLVSQGFWFEITVNDVALYV